MIRTLFFFADPTIKEVEEEGGYRFERQSAIGIEWRVCLVKASVNGKEVLRVTVEGINNNSETAAKWGANIQMCNINFMDTEITKKQSIRQEINGKTVEAVDIMDWDVLIGLSHEYMDKGTFSVSMYFIAHISSISDDEGDIRKRKIDLTTRSAHKDFALVVEGQKIYVGRQFLASYSPVFNTLFFGDFAEKDKDEVELKEVNYEDFMKLLDQLYSNNQPLCDANIEGLIKLADQFQVESVLSRAESFLIDSSSIPLSKKLLLSERYQLARLKDHCLTKLNDKEAVRKLSKTSEYKELSSELKVEILEVFVRD